MELRDYLLFPHHSKDEKEWGNLSFLLKILSTQWNGRDTLEANGWLTEWILNKWINKWLSLDSQIVLSMIDKH